MIEPSGSPYEATRRERAAGELRRQKTYLDELFELAPDAVVLTTLRNPRILRINREFTRVFGYTSEEAVGNCLRNLVMPDGPEPILPEDPELLAGRKVEWEVIRRRKDGTRFHAHIIGKRIQLSDDEDAAYLIFRDISARKEAEALFAGEKRLLEVIAAGGPLTTTLDALCRLAEDVDRGSRVSILLLDRKGEHVRPGAGPSLPASYTAALDGRPVSPGFGPCGAAAHFGEQVISTDIAMDERWADDYRALASACGLRTCWSTPIKSSEGRVLGTFAIYPSEPASPTPEQTSRIEQLTHLASIAIERAQSIDALRRSADRYALAMEAAADGHMDWNLLTGEFYISPRMLKMVGHGPDATFVDRADWVRRFPFHPEDRPRWEAAIATHFAGREAKFRGDFRIVVNGETRWLAFNFIATRDAAGNVVRWTGSIADVNDAKRDIATVLDAIPGLVAILTPAGEVDAVNHELIAYCGQPLEAMKQWGTNGTVHSDDLPRVAGVFTHSMSTGNPYDFEARIRRFDGAYRWNQVRGLPFRDSSGRIVRWYVLLSDIDASKRVEEALRLSEERYALAMRASGEGHWDWKIATDEFYASPRYLELAGFPPDMKYSRRSDIVPLLPFHPDDRPSYETAVAAHFAGETPRVDMVIRLVPNGEVRWLHIIGLCSRDADGKPARWAGSVTDITAGKLAEEALKLSEQRYSLAMEAAQDAHWDWIVGTDQYYTSPRAVEILGFPPGTTFTSREDYFAQTPLVKEDLDAWQRAARELFAGTGSRLSMDLRAIINGEVRWIQHHGVVFRDESGRAIRWCGTVRDTTERRRAEEALRESEKRHERAMLAAEAGFWDWDVPADEFYVSPKLLEMADLPAGTAIAGRADFMARAPFHPDDSAKWERAVKELFASGGTRLAMEMRSFHGGETHWALLSGMCVRDAAGKILRWTGSATDVTARKRAEEALRLSEERYALAMEASEEGHFDWNVQTDEIFASEHLKQVLDLPADAEYRTRGDMVARIPFYPGDRERINEMTRDVLPGTAVQHEFEYRLLRSQVRDLRWIHARWKIFRDAQSVAQRVIGVVSDITERKRAENELRESEARFRALATVSSEAFWEQDENLRYIASAADVGGAGWPTANRVGKTRWEMDGEPTPLSGSWLEHQAVLAARQSFRDFEYRRFRPDGELGYYSASGVPIFDGRGNFKGYYGVAKDITERKRAEQELRSRQEMLELAQKAARAAAFEWRVGAGEGENRWSPDLEAMYGIPPGSYDGTYESWKKLVHPEDWPNVLVAIKAAQQTGDVDAEYRVLHPGGAIRWLHAKGRMFFDPTGKPTRIVGFMIDVTDRHLAEQELQRMERQLRQAQRLEALGTLAGGIAHDFNNLLGAILGYGEMALRDARAGTRLRRDIENVMIAGERGHALVERILAFSRSGIGERVAVQVEAVVRETLALFAAKLPRHIVIERRLHAGSAAVLGDPTQIHQVVMNLVTNAVQAMPSAGTLRVSLERIRVEAPRVVTTGSLAAREYVVMDVSDSGSGIPAEILEKIFDPFFTTKEVGVGTGLGLSLVHGIVTGLGGAIDVATSVGKGSVFKVYLPLAGDVAAASKPGNRPERKTRRMARGRVMVIDDEAALVGLATATLAELGYSVLGFTSSSKAIEAFLESPERFDAVITDESMPGASGSELIGKMRAVRPTIPILLVSGYLSPAVIERARGAGATEVLKKPLPARQLQVALERILLPTTDPSANDLASSQPSRPAAKPRRRVGSSQSQPGRARR
jgi:PAS domain S-box-containing protein